MIIRTLRAHTRYKRRTDVVITGSAQGMSLNEEVLAASTARTHTCPKYAALISSGIMGSIAGNVQSVASSSWVEVKMECATAGVMLNI